GYLELYLNLGSIGLCLLAGVLSTGLATMRRRVASSLEMSETNNHRVVATFGIAYGVAYVFYNITEATFQGLNFLFVIFLILAFSYLEKDESGRNRSGSFAHENDVTAKTLRQYVATRAAAQV